MNSFEQLTELFERFPGIGPRQARRFVFHLLGEDRNNIERLSKLIATIKDQMTECSSCGKFFAKNGAGDTCEICASSLRDSSLLMIVERDADIPPIERSKTYNGHYFVLGGTVPLMNSEETKKLRGGLLKSTFEARIENGLKEVILAFSINPDGENTARYVETLIREYTDKHSIKMSSLGRGLSTGSELEYADSETIKNAFKNRA